MSDQESRSGDVFDIERIRGLIELMKEHDLSAVDLRQEDQRISLRRGGQLTFAPAPVAAAPAPAAPAAASAPAAPAADAANIVTINSPMVGTYYSKPNPESPNFVKVGDHVNTDTVVCIIEAMKVFNEIPAEVSGRVVAVLVENEEAVEFGKALIKIDTNG
jgi:acetyl-CoA carboxylase biotin carboxyl carrier protein